MKIEIERINNVPFDGFNLLKNESEHEGFQFLGRLEADWVNNKNQFNSEGEGFFAVKLNNQIVGVGGINNNPFYQVGKNVGRLRRFFISKQWRKKGLGTALLNYIIKEYGSNYEAIQLNTDNPSACFFYEKYGFYIVNNIENVTHELQMDNKTLHNMI